MEGESKSLLHNYLFSVLYQAVALLAPLVTTPYLSRVLGVQGIGRYSFIGSVVSCFCLLATMGTTLYGQRLIARVRHLPKVRTHFFFELFLLRFLSVVLVTGLYFLLLVPHVSDRLLYAAAAMEILAVAADISWFFYGMERFGTVTLCTALGRVSAVVCVFLFVKTREDLLRYVVVYTASILLANLLLWLFLRRELLRVRRWRPKLASHALLSLGFFLSSLAIQLYTVVDKTMLGLITRSAEQNGYYEQAQKFIHVLVALVCAGGAVFASRLSGLWKEKRKEELQSVLLISFRLVFALSLPLCAGMLLIAPRFVPLFYGEGFLPVCGLLAVLSPLPLLIGVSNVLGVQLFAATEREKLLTLSVGAGALINVLLNLLLIPRHGALGACVASVLAELAVSAVQCIMARRELPWRRLLLLLLRYAALSALMAAVGFAVSCVLGEGIGALVLIVVACAAVYVGALLLLRDPVLSSMQKKRAAA